MIIMKIKADKMCELEKFGFKKNESGSEYTKCCFWSSCNLCVGCDDRLIFICHYIVANGGDFHFEVLEEFYQLVKADMVEVEEW